MRLQRHINESLYKTSLEEILIQLYSHCKPIIKYYTSRRMWVLREWMLSGRSGNKEYFFKDVRVNRRPTDTGQEVHDLLDQAFNDKFKFRARSNAIFVTGDYVQAKKFGSGNPYIIFPTGMYKFVYSPTIQDAYYISSTIDKFGDFLISWVRQHKEKEVEAEGRRQFEKQYKSIEAWKEEDWLRYKETHSEWIWADSIALKYKKQAYKRYEQVFVEIVKDYTNDSLQKAVQSDSEIMIHTKKYMAIDFHYGKALSAWFEYNTIKTLPTKDNIRLWADKYHHDDDKWNLNLLKGNNPI